MKVVFDARCFFGVKTGVGYYAYNIIKNLLDIDKEDEYRLFYGMALRPYTGFLPDFSDRGVQTILYRFPGRIFDFAIDRFPSMKIDGLIGEYDVFHTPSFIPPPLKGKKVITVHDLAHRLHPEFFTEEMNRHLLRHLERATHEADHIITISENTKKDLIDVMGIDQGKISVIYVGASDIYRPVEDPERLNQVRAKYGTGDEFIGFFGTIEPRKNIIGLVEAFTLLKKRRPDLGHRLLIAGQKGWKYEETFKAIAESGLEDKITVTGYIQEDDLPLLMNAANLVVYPSFYEGFGMPPLEAMACGRPVVTSNTSSLPEAVGDAALTVDPSDIEGLSKAMEQVLTDKELGIEMGRKGIERAKRFTWKEAAARTLAVYREVAG